MMRLFERMHMDALWGRRQAMQAELEGGGASSSPQSGAFDGRDLGLLYLIWCGAEGSRGRTREAANPNEGSRRLQREAAEGCPRKAYISEPEAG